MKWKKVLESDMVEEKDETVTVGKSGFQRGEDDDNGYEEAGPSTDILGP